MTNITGLAYITELIVNNQTEYGFSFWSEQDALKKNTNIVVQILNGSNIRTLQEGRDYSAEILPSKNGGRIKFGQNGQSFIPSQTDGKYLMIISNTPFQQGASVNSPPTAHQLQNMFDNQQQQINQLHACCDRAIHTQFDVQTQSYPLISVFTKDFKPNNLLMLDHTGKVIIDAGFGKDEIDALKKQAALVASNIQTIANFAAAAGAAATSTAADRLAVAASLKDVNAASTAALANIQKLATDLAQAKLDIAALTKTSVAEITQKYDDVIKLINAAITKADNFSKIAVQAATDGQAAEANAKASEQNVKAIEAALTTINNLFKGTGTKGEIVARNQAGAWAVTPGVDHLKSSMLDLLGNGQLLWRDQDQIVPIDKTALGGGGSGGGTGGGSYDHKVIHDGQDDGTAPVTKQSETDHYAMLQVPYADPTSQAARANKMPKVNAAGDNWDYITMPAPSSIATIIATPGTTSTPVIDLSKIKLPNASAQYTLNANFDKPTNKWTFTATQGGAMSGNSIPNPPTDGKPHYVATKVATNGGVDISTPLVPFPEPTAQDVGKVPVVDSTGKMFEYITPLPDTEVTKRIISQTGIVDAPEILSKTGLTFVLKPFHVAYTDQATKIMTEHEYTGDQSITVPQDTIVTVYIDPSDWTFKQISGEPTELTRASNIIVCTVYSKSEIEHIKWTYDPISHQEFVLGDIGRGIGAFAKGVYLEVATKGFVTKSGGYIYDFLAHGKATTFIVGDIVTVHKLLGGTSIPEAGTNVLLQKVYRPAGSFREAALDASHKVVIHNIHSGAIYSGADDNIITEAILVIGETTYDTKMEAKKYLADARDDLRTARLLANGMLLLAQVIVEYTDTVNTDMELYNYAGVHSASSAITRKSSLPQGTPSDDGSVLHYNNDKYVLDKSIVPAIADPNIKDGQVVVSAGGNKFKGVDAATLIPALSTVSDKMLNIGMIFQPNQVITKDNEYITGATGIMGKGIKSITFKTPAKVGALGLCYDVVLKLQPNLIQNKDQVIRVEAYMLYPEPYTLDGQFIKLSGTDEITCYQMVAKQYLPYNQANLRRLSFTIFYDKI